MAWSDFFPMSNTGINNAPERPGVYQLNANSETLYFGQSNNLRRRLLEHLNSNDQCISRTTKFAYQETNNPEDLEDRILKKYKDTYGGTPLCND